MYNPAQFLEHANRPSTSAGAKIEALHSIEIWEQVRGVDVKLSTLSILIWNLIRLIFDWAWISFDWDGRIRLGSRPDVILGKSIGRTADLAGVLGVEGTRSFFACDLVGHLKESGKYSAFGMMIFGEQFELIDYKGAISCNLCPVTSVGLLVLRHHAPPMIVLGLL